ncbi:hypothetical protein VTN77DRAFT_4751 [Rasamsonia byssochlamydoides]|uniref:uncharacterized protein n=1 Tax=Rasamsonia byssochlamydoides TaxID=89139 RepID=UPI00374334AE
MNPNPTGYPALQQHGNPMLSSPAGYPVPVSSPGNQQQLPFYPNSMSSYPQPKTPQGPHLLQQHQPQPQHSFNPMTVQTSGVGAAMMPSSMSQQPPGPHANLPFSAPSPYPPATIPTTTTSPSHTQEPSTLPTTAAPAASQNMATFPNSNNMFPAQQRPQAPNQQPQGAVPSTVAQSQAAAAREKARISTLLDINSALLQEVVNLQAQGKAGLPPMPPGSQQSSPTQEQQSASPVSSAEQQNHANDASKPPAQKPSQEYIECMRRLQANLAYLATIADRAKKSGGVLPAAPAILTPPPSLPSLNEMYAKLNELFPGASRGTSTTPQQQQQQQQQQQRPGQHVPMPGNGGPGPVAVGDNGV